MLPQGYFGATNTTQRRVTASKLITETPAVPGWDKHLEWDHSCIHHLVLSSPEDISLPTPPFLSWMCTASPSSGTGEETVNSKAGWEQLKLPLPPKPFLSNYQLCVQSHQQTGDKVRDPLPKRHCSNIFPQHSDKTGTSSTRKSSAFLWKATTVPAPSEDPEGQGSQDPH